MLFSANIKNTYFQYLLNFAFLLNRVLWHWVSRSNYTLCKTPFSLINFKSASFQRQWMSLCPWTMTKGKQGGFEKPVCTISLFSATYTWPSELYRSLNLHNKSKLHYWKRVRKSRKSFCTSVFPRPFCGSLSLSLLFFYEMEEHNLMLHSNTYPDRPEVKKKPKSIN